MLSDYLNLEKEPTQDQSSLGQQTDPIPEELQEILNFFTSELQQQTCLESYALSTLIETLNPKLDINESEKPIFKE